MAIQVRQKEMRDLPFKVLAGVGLEQKPDPLLVLGEGQRRFQVICAEYRSAIKACADRRSPQSMLSNTMIDFFLLYPLVLGFPNVRVDSNVRGSMPGWKIA